jgi:hypothetical protein
MGVSLAASRKRDARTGHSAHSASLPDYRQPINRQAVTLTRRDGSRLDGMAGGTVFLGIRTIQERNRRDGAALCCADAGPRDR